MYILVCLKNSFKYIYVYRELKWYMDNKYEIFLMKFLYEVFMFIVFDYIVLVFIWLLIIYIYVCIRENVLLY